MSRHAGVGCQPGAEGVRGPLREHVHRPAGAPLAIQVADRWHLLHNLAGAAERIVARHRSCLRDDPAPAGPAPPTSPQPSPQAPGGPLAQRTGNRHAEVHAALSDGLNLTDISRMLRLNRTTARRYARAPTPGDLSTRTPIPLPPCPHPPLAPLPPPSVTPPRP